MLERLRIQNYQCHADLKLVLGPGCTTICGNSDHGKSAALRALRWLCTGKPAGAAFIKHGAEQTTVSLWVDGRRVTRRRGAAADAGVYTLDTDTYRHPANVPDAIQAVLQTGPGNFAGQHDGPYWFTDTAGAVSRNLNAIVDLGAIDDTLANLARAAAHAKTAVAVSGQRLVGAEATAAELSYVPRLLADLDKVGDLATKAVQTQQDALQLREAMAAVKRYQDAAKGAQAMATAAGQVSTLAAAAWDARQAADALWADHARVMAAEVALAQATEAAVKAKSALDGIKTCPVCERPLKLK